MPMTMTAAAAAEGFASVAGDGEHGDNTRRRGVGGGAEVAAVESDELATRKDGYAFAGAIMLNMFLGSLYCWSCYLVPLEQALGVGRGVLSTVFSLATLCFTAAVAKVGPGCYSRLSPAVIGAGAAILGGAGMLVASQALSYVSVVPLFVGYALMFGVASGVGYGLSVQISAMAPFGEGLSTGLITSARAAGAFVFAPVIRSLLDAGGVQHAFCSMAALLTFTAVPLWLLLARAGLTEPIANGRRDRSLERTRAEIERDRQLRPAMFTLWAALGLGVSAGLMVIAHAAALLYCHGATIGVATAGVSIVSLFTTGGRILGGWACDRTAVGAAKVLRFAPFVAVPPLLWAAVAETSVLAALCALAAASVTYGVFATAVPVELRRRTGTRDFARAYGKVYTAWGVAGLAAPWLAGLFYDARGDYTMALIIAAGLCCASAVAAATLKPGRSHEEWVNEIAGEAEAGAGAGAEGGGSEGEGER